MGVNNSVKQKEIDLSIIMPCYNEEQTIGECIREAKKFIKINNLSAEIVVVDNASNDDSFNRALINGANVIYEPHKGYGCAIRTGIKESHGKVLIIGDCDTTYDFLHLEKMYSLLASEQYGMVIGNRYTGGIEKGSMPLSHKVGVRILSLCANIKFHCNIYDFHCGLRGMTRKIAEELEFKTDGMEFATEMIVKASRANVKIGQIPVTLSKCKYKRKTKLRTIRDGVRHLKYIIMTN